MVIVIVSPAFQVQRKKYNSVIQWFLDNNFIHLCEDCITQIELLHGTNIHSFTLVDLQIVHHRVKDEEELRWGLHSATASFWILTTWEQCDRLFILNTAK